MAGILPFRCIFLLYTCLIAWRHGVIVKAGKDYYRKDPRCGEYPLKGWNERG